MKTVRRYHPFLFGANERDTPGVEVVMAEDGSSITWADAYVSNEDYEELQDAHIRLKDTLYEICLGMQAQDALDRKYNKLTPERKSALQERVNRMLTLIDKCGKSR